MPFAQTWDETIPGGSRNLNLGDNDIRDFKAAIRERLAEDHRFYSSEGGQTNVGLHNKVSLVEQASDPASLADAFILYAKLVGSYAELHGRHENAGVKQLTLNGLLWIAALTVASEARGDMIVRGVSTWGRTAIGTANKIWKSDGTDPLWDVLSGALLQTSGGFNTTLSVTNPTANRTITIPNENVNLTGFSALIPKAWANINGATGVIRASSGVSSVNRTATGIYTITWSTAFADTNYAVGGWVTGGGFCNGDAGTYSTTQAVVQATNHAGSQFDPTILNVFAFGNQ